jgi:glucokinase
VKAGHWIGLDVGGSKILGVVVDHGNEVVGRERVATRRDEGPEAVLQRCLALARGLGAGRNVLAAGIGFAGLVDAGRGRVASSIMLPGWDGFPLGARVSEELALPCRVENDANAAGYGEWIALGSPPGLDLVVLTIGTGIGGAILFGGRLHRGASGGSGEIGNMSIDWNGPECWCGSRGCLNMLASGSALSGRYAELTRGPALPVQELGQRARAGDGVARRVIEDGARALGAGLANLINLLNPARIGLSGGVTDLGDPWLALVRAEAARRAFAESLGAVTIARCRLGEESGAIGAAALARAELGGA